MQSYSDKLPNLEANHYETDNDICQQLHSHYFLGTDKLASLALPAKFDNYQKTITEQVMHYVDKYEIPTNKCLDLGCSVGRTSFTLAQHFQHVDAVDFSARYIQHGVNLQQGKSVRYQLQNEGEIVDFHEISLANVDLPCSQNIQFSQGDLSNLKNNFIGYDLIIVQQVLEESYNPSQFLQSVHERMNKNALLIVVSTYNFDEQNTEKSNWLGGRKINGENVTGLDGLSLLLNKHFTFLAQQDLTRAIQINNRHFTLSFPHLSAWQLN